MCLANRSTLHPPLRCEATHSSLCLCMPCLRSAHAFANRSPVSSPPPRNDARHEQRRSAAPPRGCASLTCGKFVLRPVRGVPARKVCVWWWGGVCVCVWVWVCLCIISMRTCVRACVLGLFLCAPLSLNGLRSRFLTKCINAFLTRCSS